MLALLQMETRTSGILGRFNRVPVLLHWAGIIGGHLGVFRGKKPSHEPGAKDSITHSRRYVLEIRFEVCFEKKLGWPP